MTRNNSITAHVVAKLFTRTLLSGFPLASTLTLIFVVAKLLHRIDWNWLLVFAPLWALPALFIGVPLTIGLLGLLAYSILVGLDTFFDWRRRRRWERQKAEYKLRHLHY